MKLIYGVGFNDGKYPASGSHRFVREYSLWKAMLQRCFEEKALNKRPTYKGCSVSNNFKSYSYFYEWCNKQIGFGVEEYQLDKDLLFKDNKIYSENNCLFLPRRINSALVRKESARGCLPAGVYWNKINKNYVARCTINGKTVHIMSSLDSLEAFYAYKTVKEDYLKHLAEEYRNQIDIRAYNALINYQVEITD